MEGSQAVAKNGLPIFYNVISKTIYFRIPYLVRGITPLRNSHCALKNAL